MAVKRKRDIQLNFRVSPHELELIEAKMARVGATNREAYLRKMAIDGVVVNLEAPELRELISLLEYSGNNLNRLAKRVHETFLHSDAPEVKTLVKPKKNKKEHRGNQDADFENAGQNWHPRSRNQKICLVEDREDECC